jgi:outer membrane protein assembly factor BamD (BamD/ComL family)
MQMLCLLWMLAAESPGTEARYATEAALLFEDGQARLQAGKYGTAKLAFQALISVYPESPLVDRAREAMRKSEERADDGIGSAKNLACTC